MLLILTLNKVKVAIFDMIAITYHDKHFIFSRGNVSGEICHPSLGSEKFGFFHIYRRGWIEGVNTERSSENFFGPSKYQRLVMIGVDYHVK